MRKFYKVIWKTSAGSTDWNTASNWSTGVVPDADNNITIPAGASNMPVVSSSVSVKNLTEFNIGHTLISRGLFIGIRAAVNEMKVAMQGYSQR